MQAEGGGGSSTTHHPKKKKKQGGGGVIHTTPPPHSGSNQGHPANQGGQAAMRFDETKVVTGGEPVTVVAVTKGLNSCER